MMILGSKRDKLIDSLNLSVPMKKLTKGKYVHDELEFNCLELSYSLEPEDFSPPNLQFIPLWESELSITGFYLDGTKTVFIHYYIEDIDDFNVIGYCVNDLIDFLIRKYVEYDYEEEVKKLLVKN